MLLKLSLTGIKSRFKDYLILLSGLIMASAIFYMFEALATNQSFIKQNVMVKYSAIIFQMGSVLLAIITLFYIIYANTFLMSMRQRDYGMFMMLGAKKRKIGRLIFMETLIVGLIATVVGTLVGIGLTAGVGHLLINKMDISAQSFQPFYFPAILITLLFFVVLFMLAAVFNRRALLNTPILKLLNEAEQPQGKTMKPNAILFQSVLGLVLIGSGYYLLSHMAQYQVAGLFGSIAAIFIGTFLIFNSLFSGLVQLLKRSKGFSEKQLNTFLLGQLSFRLGELNRVLTMVAMLFALALGAITVGMGFSSIVDETVAATSPYSVVLQDPSAKEQHLLGQLTDKKEAIYATKKVGKTRYFKKSDFEKSPLYMYDESKKTSMTSSQLVKINPAKMTAKNEDNNWEGAVRSTLESEMLAPVVVSDKSFSAISAKTQRIYTVRLASFNANKDSLKALSKGIPQSQIDMSSYLVNTYVVYQMVNVIYGGMEFMGFFLGVAMLAMLASMLMFKILSSAATDKKRYDLLNQIGARRQLMKKSINREIGILFLLPGIVGAIHVLFGLQMFKMLIPEPYDHIAIPFIIFAVLYLGYYWITVSLYKGIVLKK
ncbi:FtsX-like permease family protein [Dellaglioa sp. L3N]